MIDDTLWVGHVEVHLRSSDWDRHGHSQDEHYGTVILHVVLTHDREIHSGGALLPVVELHRYLDAETYSKYLSWQKSALWIPCSGSAVNVEATLWTGWKERLLIERMAEKTELVMNDVRKSAGDWDEVLYRRMAVALGGKQNKTAFEMLADHVPLKLARKYCHSQEQLDALLAGASGWAIESMQELYDVEFHHLKHKHALETMPRVAWQRGGVRPSGHPHVRIAVLSSWLHARAVGMAHFLETSPKQWADVLMVPISSGIELLLSPVPTNCPKRVGDNIVGHVLVNAVAPCVFAYGKHHGSEIHVDNALEVLDLCDREDNNVVRQWLKEGVSIKSARDSQALLQLHKMYCTQKKCLSCTIGLKLLKTR